MDYFDDETIEYYNSNIHNLGLWESEKQIFDKFVNKNDEIIDIGCGTGRTTLSLYDYGYKKIIGIDISGKFIDIARENAIIDGKRIEFKITDISSNKLDIKEKYDCAFFSYNGLMTIERKVLRLQAILNIHQLLKQNGIFIFTSYDRMLNVKYRMFWFFEKIRWILKINNPNLEMYGDRVCKKSKTGKYIYVPIKKEILELMKLNGFELKYASLRNKICKENFKVRKETDNCMFYVFERID